MKTPRQSKRLFSRQLSEPFLVVGMQDKVLMGAPLKCLSGKNCPSHTALGEVFHSEYCTCHLPNRDAVHYHCNKLSLCFNHLLWEWTKSLHQPYNWKSWFVARVPDYPHSHEPIWLCKNSEVSHFSEFVFAWKSSLCGYQSLNGMASTCTGHWKCICRTCAQMMG